MRIFCKVWPYCQQLHQKQEKERENCSAVLLHLDREKENKICCKSVNSSASSQDSNRKERCVCVCEKGEKLVSLGCSSNKMFLRDDAVP